MGPAPRRGLCSLASLEYDLIRADFQPTYSARCRVYARRLAVAATPERLCNYGADVQPVDPDRIILYVMGSSLLFTLNNLVAFTL